MNDEQEPPILKFADLLKPGQAAQKLGMSKSFLRELTIAGRVPAIDFGAPSKTI